MFHRGYCGLFLCDLCSPVPRVLRASLRQIPGVRVYGCGCKGLRGSGRRGEQSISQEQKMQQQRWRHYTRTRPGVRTLTPSLNLDCSNWAKTRSVCVLVAGSCYGHPCDKRE